MEINAKVYAVADDEKLLEKARRILTGQTFQRYYYPDTMEPCEVLPLSKTWYGITERAEPTYGPEEWLDCLRECAQLLKKNGAVVVEFRSPDAPDDYLEYAFTTSSGKAGSGSRATLIDYDRALGNKDVQLALQELFAERTAQERARICRRHEKRKQSGEKRETLRSLRMAY